MYPQTSPGAIQFKAALLHSTAALMLICAAPMAAWSAGYPSNVSASTTVTAGLQAAHIAAAVYGFSVATALTGLSAGHGSITMAWPRALAWSQLAAIGLLVLALHSRELLVLAPLSVLTLLLLYAMGPFGARSPNRSASVASRGKRERVSSH